MVMDVRPVFGNTPYTRRSRNSYQDMHTIDRGGIVAMQMASCGLGVAAHTVVGDLGHQTFSELDLFRAAWARTSLNLAKF